MQELVETESRDPNTFLVRSKRLPTALIRPLPEQTTVKLQEVEPFDKTFGPKAQRKRSRLPTTDLEELMRSSAAELSTYRTEADTDTAAQRELRQLSYKTEYDPKLVRGQTNRVYSEIFKVIDSSDVIVYVLDARDPDGTRSRYLEKYLRLPENEHKHMVFVLNKCDLVPTWVTASWIKVLSKAYPTIAFHASMEHPFGKGELMSVLRQFAQLHRDKQQISVGLCGYPNVGKSSIINALLGTNSCRTAPVPGETKVWQYVTLTKRIFLIDAPGVVWAGTNQLRAPLLKGDMSAEAAAWAAMRGDEAEKAKEERQIGQTEEERDSFRDNVTTAAELDQYHYENVMDVALVLRGVLRPEYLEHPEKYIPAIIQRVRPEHLNRTYSLRPALYPAERWSTADELLKAVALKQGRLLRAGEPDVRTVARKIIEDFVRGKLPHFIAPYTPEDIEEYKRTIAAERVHWHGKTDAELISFENTQNLRGLGKNFTGDPQDDAFHNAFVDVDGERQRAREEQKAAEAERIRNRKPKMTSIGELYEGGESDEDSRSEELAADDSEGSRESRSSGSPAMSGTFHSGSEDAGGDVPMAAGIKGSKDTKATGDSGNTSISDTARSLSETTTGLSEIARGSSERTESTGDGSVSSSSSPDVDWEEVFAGPSATLKSSKQTSSALVANSHVPPDPAEGQGAIETFVPPERPSRSAQMTESVREHRHSKKVIRASSTALPEGFVVAKEKKKRAQQVEGVKRAVKLLKTRDRELKRALLSGVVDQSELAMLTHAAGKHKKAKRDRGGASHGKTGEYFYREAKAKKSAIEKKIGKKL